MNAWDGVVVHLKGNTSSIKQTWRTGPIHQRAAWISYWVQLRRDKCRTSSVCPRLPIDRDHHCDVAFYLTTCSLKPYIKPYIILFPTQKSHRRRGGEKGASLILSFILTTYGYHFLKLFSWLLTITLKVLRVLTRFRNCCCCLFHPGIIPQQMNITPVNMSLRTERLTPLNTGRLPLSGTYSNVSNPAERKASWVAIDPRHYGIPCQ